MLSLPVLVGASDRRWSVIRNACGIRLFYIGTSMCVRWPLGWLHYSQAVPDAMNQEGLYDRHPELIPPNISGFIGARWLDPVLLILFIALFIWEIKVLFTRTEKRNHNEVGS